jgi:hypothetical protein
MRSIILLLCLVALSGCAGTQSTRAARYESQCAAAGAPPGSPAMANCIAEKHKDYDTRRAREMVREQSRRMDQIKANSRVYR